MTVFARGGMLYAQIKNHSGKWCQVATGFRIDQRSEAARWVRDYQRNIDDERAGGITGNTLADWIAEWSIVRGEQGVDGNNDTARLTKYVLPRIGQRPIADIDSVHLAELFAEIRKTPIETGKPPAPRTVYNVYSALCAAFRDAVFARKVKTSPCMLAETQLGPKLDATPGWNRNAVFTRDEAKALISSPAIPWDRRVAYAIELLAALRPGENAVLRWRHYDPTVKPLGSLFVGEALNSKRGTTKRTKTDTEKDVPVHPTLAAMLAEWKLSGWAEMHGRNPTPDDLIVPLPPADARARTKRADDEPFRTSYYAGRRWRDEDLRALGWRDRRHYDMRATFVTLALEDGADEHIIETRVTHTRKTRSAFSRYNRGKQWAIVCTEVAKLCLVREALGAVVVQSSNSCAMSPSSGLRRRASNTGPPVLGDARRESTDGNDTRRAPPGIAENRGSALSLVQSQCDVGMAMMRAPHP